MRLPVSTPVVCPGPGLAGRKQQAKRLPPANAKRMRVDPWCEALRLAASWEGLDKRIRKKCSLPTLAAQYAALRSHDELRPARGARSFSTTVRAIAAIHEQEATILGQFIGAWEKAVALQQRQDGRGLHYPGSPVLSLDKGLRLAVQHTMFHRDTVQAFGQFVEPIERNLDLRYDPPPFFAPYLPLIDAEKLRIDYDASRGSMIIGPQAG